MGFEKRPKLKRLLEPQVQMLENARSLAATDGVYKTYVYAATLSDSVEIVREVIALGGEKNLFGTVSTVGNKETKDTALHIAAMNGNTNMVLDFLSIVSSIESWFTSRNSSGFSPRDCAVLAQSSIFRNPSQSFGRSALDCLECSMPRSEGIRVQSKERGVYRSRSCTCNRPR